MIASTLTNLKKIYDIDDYLWIQETVKLLREKRFTELDLDNLIEELDDLVREKKNKVKSLLRQITINLLLLEYWQEQKSLNQNHWQAEITEFRFQLNGVITTNLYKHLVNNLQQIYQKSNKYAQRKTLLTTFPQKCPYTPDQLLDEDWFPENVNK
jgi:hypothetical protein